MGWLSLHEWDGSVCITIISKFSFLPAVVEKVYKTIRLHSNAQWKKMDCLMVFSCKYVYISNLSTMGALKSSCNIESETTFFLYSIILNIYWSILWFLGVLCFLRIFDPSHLYMHDHLGNDVYWVLLTFHSKFTFDYTSDIYLILSKHYSFVWLLVFIQKSLRLWKESRSW